MKKILNILCVVMLVLMVADVALPLVLDAEGMAQAFNDGWEAGQGSSPSTPPHILCNTVALLTGIPVAICVIFSFVSFVRFILNVNRDNVFVWENISLLRWAGWGLLAGHVWLTFIELVEHHPYTQIQQANVHGFVFGVFILIVAEVFTIGLKLREEQDLTI